MKLYVAAATLALVALAAMQATASLHSQLKAAGPPANIWAVLVAGSNTYDNYRHQADICHAYQILHAHGVPDEQIVVMMYDDIAFDEENPTPGIIINKPNGNDVYGGVKKDYVGDDVTPQNFLNVLLGKEEAMKNTGSGKVLKSGPNDHVFVNFADHGAPGILAFPDDELDVQDLISTLKTMNQENLYGKLVLYVEACESGSMFDGVLPDDINIYASTAANPEESSYACYWDDERETYLGDLYSVNWMEDTDNEEITKETIHKQFLIVKNETDESHVSQYGDLTIAKLTVSEFQGAGSSAVIPRNPMRHPTLDAIPAPDVPLHTLHRKLAKYDAKNTDKTTQIRKDLQKLKRNRAFLDEKVHEIVAKSVSTNEQAVDAKNQRLALKDLDCHRQVTKHFSKNCFQLSKNAYALRKVFVLVNMCEMGVKPAKIISAMDQVCTHPPVHGIN